MAMRPAQTLNWTAGTALALLLAGCAPSPHRAERGGGILVPPSGTRGVGQNVLTPALAAGVNLGDRVGPSNKEAQIIESSYRQLEERAVRVLSCSYAAGGSRASFFFWKDAVPYPQDKFVAISPAHPLGALGDTAFSTCPKTFEQASAAQRASIERFNALADQRITALQTPPPEAGGRVNENQCLYTETNNYGGSFYKNNCSYTLNLAWEVGNQFGLSDMAQFQTLRPGYSFRGVPYQVKHMSALACRAPMMPVLRKKPHVDRREWTQEVLWRCEHPTQ